MRMRVYYEDTDLAGIVYYANYLKFIERGRTEALIALGVDQAALKAETGIVFAVRRVEADFLAPARFQDQLVVTTALAGDVGRAGRSGAGGAARRRRFCCARRSGSSRSAPTAGRRGCRRRRARRWRGWRRGRIRPGDGAALGSP